MAKRVKLFGLKKSEDAYTRYQRATDGFMDAIKSQKGADYRVDDYSVGFMLDCLSPDLLNRKEKQIARLRYCARKWEESLQEVDKNPRMICHRYGWHQFLDYVNWCGNENKRASQSWDRAGGFHGTETFQEAMDLARYGWDGLDKIIPNVQRFPLPDIKSVADMDCRYHVAGGAVDIGRYLADVPDCMHRMGFNYEFRRPAKCIKVLFTCDMHAGYSPMELAAAGYRAYEMLETMERANIHTELVYHVRAKALDLVAKRKQYCTGIYDVYVTVKKSDEVLNLSRIMFALAHPSMLRRLVLSEMEKNPRDVIKQFLFVHGCGYGHPDVLPRAEFENRDDTMYMVASDLFSKNSEDVIRAQNEKIAQAMTAQKYSYWR